MTWSLQHGCLEKDVHIEIQDSTSDMADTQGHVHWYLEVYMMTLGSNGEL